MALTNSSCSPSSSAVTIPRAGKSILKRPPPVQPSLFSRITRFLPTTPTTPTTPQEDVKDQPLKRAHFILPQIAIVYPISSVNPPSTPMLKEEKKAIEDREFERRRKVLRGTGSATPSMRSGETGMEEWWSLDKVDSFYRECCTGCDEQPDLAITAAFKNASASSPRSVDFSGVQLTVMSASVLSDVLTIEWGLRKLAFKECDLNEHILKPILHSLLIPDSLSYLSLASNRKLKAPAFRLVGAYVSQTKSLQFLDLSQNNLDKKAIEYIVAALATAPNPGLVSLRLDDCALRPAALETLSRAVRTSSLRNISLRHNRITATGAVALALMIRDYPDTVPTTSTTSSFPSSASGTPSSSAASSPTSSHFNLPLPTSPTTPTPSTLTPSSAAPPQSAPARPGPVLPPPRHPTQNVQTTYTPYIPRSRRPGPGTPSTTTTPVYPNPPLSAVPIITSSSQGGVTTRHLPPQPHSAAPGGVFDRKPLSGLGGLGGAGSGRHDAGPSAALLDKGGITYIAQVLKRNRTLKVLNLSENKLDVGCLVAIAEALKYNTTLETLDLSKNPLSSPSPALSSSSSLAPLTGIQSLRTAFTLNTALKRLFLSSTGMGSAGAIALAEFLPEAKALLHLDLTGNKLEMAGVMALNEGLKRNWVMRCLDVEVPPGDEGFAREILNTCIRNTEEAERNTQVGGSGRGLGKGVWNMIEESELAKSIKLDEEKQAEANVAVRARECVVRLTELLHASANTTPTAAGKSTDSTTPTTTPKPKSAPPPLSLSISTPRTGGDLAETSRVARTVVKELTAVIQGTEDAALMEELLDLNDQLMALLDEVPVGLGMGSVDLASGNLEQENGSNGSGSPSPARETEGEGETGVDSGRNEKRKPALTLRGLGVKLNGVDLDVGVQGHHLQPNGIAHRSTAPVSAADDDELDLPATPRVDKGKARAEPEPEEHEKVLSPTSVLAAKAARAAAGTETESDLSSEEGDDEEMLVYVPEGGVSSPNDRSRSWVAEEGEVFRKGTVLLGPEEMEGEYAGEELRKELLEAMVERPPPRPLQDDYLLDMPSSDRFGPMSPSTPTDEQSTPTSPEPTKPPPRPYISRTRSSSNNSILRVISPTIPQSAPPVSSEFGFRGSPKSPTAQVQVQQAQGSRSSSPSLGIGIGPSLSRIVRGSTSSSEVQ
ncbi:hypothetical protein H0H92_008216 [Tricholoma furcatifolium]|nr:hypothetical protein H0H92_008216 [Tricholoma furcatifolium]